MLRTLQRKWVLLTRGRELKRRRQVRNIWQGREEHPADWETITSYFYHHYPAEAVIDEQTWQDLELDRVLERMNRTISLPGAQYLYQYLKRKGRGVKEFDRLHQVIACFREDRRLRERLQIALLPLRHVGGDLSEVFAGSWGKVPRYSKYLNIFPWVLALFSCLSVLYSFLWIVLIGLLGLSWLLHLRLSGSMSQKMPECDQLIRILAVVKKLGAWKGTPIDKELYSCHHYRYLVKKTIKKLFWFYLDPTKFNELAATMLRYLQMYPLLDIIAYHRLIAYAERYALIWKELFDAIGFLDAAIAIAAFTNGLSEYTKVEWVDEQYLCAEGLYHPMLEKAVGNDIKLAKQSLLITGSNMSGKTTFLKTVGINVWLSQTLGLACAKRFVAARFVLFSSIGVEETLRDGKSYYYREIERILSFINAPIHHNPNLFLIDEIYRGTNTAERLAASSAVLEELSRKGLVLVTTHDIELEEKLSQWFMMVHFREEVENGEHFFDYRIHPGPCRTRNAIRLLQLVGYPDNIVDRALNDLKTFADYSIPEIGKE
jgi:DNA mismatch repair ATPase MutS